MTSACNLHCCCGVVVPAPDARVPLRGCNCGMHKDFDRAAAFAASRSQSLAVQTQTFCLPAQSKNWVPSRSSRRRPLRKPVAYLFDCHCIFVQTPSNVRNHTARRPRQDDALACPRLYGFCFRKVVPPRLVWPAKYFCVPFKLGMSRHNSTAVDAKAFQPLHVRTRKKIVLFALLAPPVIQPRFRQRKRALSHRARNFTSTARVT